ncbi:hypothetical protein BSKO_11512 [Bryopsis sp. KO-2023]|nr:hypothetical protein BSKO_11512 [Bryopsis sp. KO-2023]
MEDSAYWELRDEGSFWVYVKPAAYYNHLEWRFKRNPMFLKRCLEYTRKAEPKKASTGATGTSVQVEFSEFTLPRKWNSSGLEKLSVFVAVCEGLSKKEFRPLMVKLVQLPSPKKFASTQTERIPPVVFSNVKHPLDRLVVVFMIRASHPDISGLRSDENETISSALTRRTCFGLIPVGSKVWWAPAPMNLKATRASQLQLHAGKVTIAELSMWDGSANRRCEMLLMGSIDEEKEGVPKLMVNVKTQQGNEQPSTSGGRATEAGYFSAGEGDTNNKARPRGAPEARVTFRYVYGGQQKKSVQEITQNFGCPLCQMECANFVGLKHHLTSSHDLLTFQEERDTAPTLWVQCRRGIYDQNGDVCCSETQTLASSSQEKVFFLNRRGKRNGRLLGDVPEVVNTVQTTATGRPRREHVGPSAGARKTSIRRRSTAQGKGGAGKGTGQTKKRQGSYQRAKRTVQQPHDTSRCFYHSTTAMRMTAGEAAGNSDTDDDDNDKKWELQTLRDMTSRLNATEAERKFMYKWSRWMRFRSLGYADYKMPEACYRFTLENRDFLKTEENRMCFAFHLSTLFNFRLVTPELISNCLKALEVDSFFEKLKKDFSESDRSIYLGGTSGIKTRKSSERVNAAKIATEDQMETEELQIVGQPVDVEMLYND